ncbi:hypothetical protein KIN20_034663 [Parelaphostrongylus tenuis]|uniref:Uncharacterized protein n=1 Tax=Parelaphostrongylus tenuis TaxID=148309 RepID=A0AAD5RAN5_PARTN|nr:hypothetical protein KIN20_034663 [Parelaphostrongylus tenuis]
MALLKECLSYSFFRWSGKYFAQIRGLAMGHRLAPTLDIGNDYNYKTGTTKRADVTEELANRRSSVMRVFGIDSELSCGDCN